MGTQISIFDGANKFENDKPIRLIECFAGYGSQALALKYLGIPFEHHKIAEWAVKSIQAYKDMHFPNDNTDYSCGMSFDELIDYLFGRGISADYNTPMTREQIKRMGESKCRTVYNNIKATNNLVSVCNVKAKDLQITDTDKFTYLLTYSFPCFTADSMVLTENGYKKISDVAVGDMVLTHDNTYKKVLKTFDNGVHDVYRLKGMGVDEIKATANHKFYVREMHRVGHDNKRCFKEPTWKELKDLTKKDYLGIAINQNSTIPNWQGVNFSRSHKNELKAYMGNKDFWWLIGRYLADGWQRTQGGIVICCGKSKKHQMDEKLDRLFHYCCIEDRTSYKYHIARKELQAFVDQFGRGAKNKKVTKDILDLPCELLESFLDGYLSADGCCCDGVYKATSISRELVYGIAQCVAKVYKTPYRIYKTIRPKTCVIEGRTVNQNDTYDLVFKKEKCKQDKAFYEDGHVWYPIKSIEKIESQNVYDIEVEENHSFTVQNTIVHNCQDLSNAGLGKGMQKGSGTRSGLLWEIERILKECDELPQILLMENVPEVIGKKNKDSLGEWISFLDGIGYRSKWEVLNGTEFGMPQNRKRCFMVSILGDYYYEFPQKTGCTLRLKDLLEKNVSEEYYLSDNILNYFVKHTKECEEKGNGFRFAPTKGDCFAKCVLTTAGNRMDDNFIDDTVHSVVKLPHGYFGGKIERNPEYSPTIDTGSGNWHTLIGEETYFGVGLNETESFRKPPLKECSRTLLANKANCGEGVLISQCECVGHIDKDGFNEMTGRVYGTDNAAPTVRTFCGGGQEIKVAVENERHKNDNESLEEPRLVESLALDEQNGYIRKDGFVGTLTTDGSSPKHNNRVIEVKTNCIEKTEKMLKDIGDGKYPRDTAYGKFLFQSSRFDDKPLEECAQTIKASKVDCGVIHDLRVRKLTPKECFRLMGVKDEDYERVAKNQSKSSLYHCAGDSIITNCLMAIFKELFM